MSPEATVSVAWWHHQRTRQRRKLSPRATLDVAWWAPSEATLDGPGGCNPQPLTSSVDPGSVQGKRGEEQRGRPGGAVLANGWACNAAPSPPPGPFSGLYGPLCGRFSGPGGAPGSRGRRRVGGGGRRRRPVGGSWGIAASSARIARSHASGVQRWRRLRERPALTPGAPAGTVGGRERLGHEQRRKLGVCNR